MSSVPGSDQPTAASDTIQRLERRIADLVAIVERHERELQIQVTRTGQVQADIDLIRSAWPMTKSTDPA